MQEYLSSLLVAFPVFAPLMFVLLRAVPIIIPPIPGVLFDLVGVAIFGWQLGLALALMGALLGSSASFFIARYFREPLVKRFVPLQKLHELETQYSEKQKFWGLVGLRFVTSPFFDYANYAVGLTNMSYLTFIFSTLIGVLPYAFFIYYFGGLTLYQGPLVALIFFVGVAIVAGLLGRIAIKRYF